MSEYQYFEFLAIDRPLTTEEMRELRSYSTRARITPTSFINDYSWGGFKGIADAWMEKYFDAFLYFANWGTRVLKLRLPARLLDLETAAAYCGGESASVHEKSGKVILSFVSEGDPGDDWVEGEGLLSSLVSVRAELERGDLRALYLAWLLYAQTGELDDSDKEPPVPPGLGRLSPSLENLADFLRIDCNLLDVAAETSPRRFSRTCGTSTPAGRSATSGPASRRCAGRRRASPPSSSGLKKRGYNLLPNDDMIMLRGKPARCYLHQNK
jgi:hypothetical protein